MELLHKHFVKIAKKNPKKLAFIDRTTGRRISYSKALIGSLILSKKFKKYKEQFIGIMIPTSAGCGLSIIGSLMCGKIPVMINYSTGADSNVKYAQEKCGFKTVITSKVLLEKIKCPYVEGMVFIEDIMRGVSLNDKISAGFFAKLPEFIIKKFVYKGNTDDSAVILFTSGSEKTPKAVQLTHKNIYSNIESFSKVFELSCEDIMLANLPFFHVFGLTVTLWTGIFHGMTIVAYSNPLEYKTVCNIIREEMPSVMVGTPSFLSGYLRASLTGDFESLRIVVSGADKCPPSLREDFLCKHGITLYEGYGTTETSPVISANTPKNNKPGSIGKVIPNVSVKIENYETGEECRTGEVGRIMVKGDLVMKGYFDDFEETSMRIRHGWYDTGDMGYFDNDGYLFHSGRLQRFVKIGGEMVSLSKVEDVMEKLLGDDISCCVVEIPDMQKGAKIVAVVTNHIDEKKLYKQMAEFLPNIAIPKVFYVLPELPRMGSGKIDFRRVTELVKEKVESSK